MQDDSFFLKQMSSLEVSSFLGILNKHPVCRPLCFPFMCSLAVSELHKSVPWYIYRSRCGRRTDSSPVSFKKNNTSKYVRKVQETGVGTLLDDSQFVACRGVDNPRAGRVVGAGGDGAVTMVTWVGGSGGVGTIWMEDDCFKGRERIAGPLSLEQQDRDSGFIFLVLQNQAKQKTQCSSDSCTDQIRTQQQYSAWERVCHRWSTAFSCTKKELKCVF